MTYGVAVIEQYLLSISVTKFWRRRSFSVGYYQTIYHLTHKHLKENYSFSYVTRKYMLLDSLVLASQYELVIIHRN